ncbi:MAG: arsenite methyltransferase [Vulcanimicrobiota bacterium]
MKSITELIQQKYGETAESGLSGQNAGIQAVAQAFGYSAEELESIPAEANMGLSCGNPLATAHLKPGEVVVDLGSGGGLDVFLAAAQVGPTGKAIGIDMTPQMLELARANAVKGGYQNVEFLEGQIDDLPLSDASADVVISNCVINLAPDKRKVFQEMHRVLKPGGRVAISDIALKQELPDELAQNAAALVGCIAGAVTIQEYEQGLREAGFSEVAIIDSGADLMAYAQAEGAAACCSPAPASSGACCSPAPEESSCCSPAPQDSEACCSPNPSRKPMHQDLGELLRRYDVNAYAASVKVFAIK